MRRLVAYLLVLKYLNRIKKASYSNRSYIDYSYDAIGRLNNIKKMQVAGQEPVNYSYDANSRLTQILTSVIASGAWQSLSFDFAYDALGRRLSLTRPNGVTTNYTYDNGSNLLNIESLNPLSAVLEKIGYTYDANGNRTSMDRLNVQPKLPNPVSNTSYNEANQTLTFNDKAITYDANGNMETVTNSCGVTTYIWNVRNQLVGISGFNTDCSVLTANFKYDALGRRIEKTINGKTIQYLYDGLDIIQEIEDGMVIVNYIRTLNIDEPLARIKTDGTVRYFQQDALGSVIALTDENGVIKTQYSYDPFGNVTVSGEPSDNPFQYTGRENDNTGLYYYRARYYSPELQRFISEDPIGLAGGDINYFAYVGNNPVNFVDPLGLDSLRYHVNALFPYLEWLNDSGFPIGIYPAYSGTPSGRYKPLPYGTYTGKNLRRRTKPGMRCGDEGWSLNLEPSNFSTNRTLLRIHPDEPPFGTKGCIGVDCKYAQDLYNQLLNYFSSGHSEIPVEVTY